MDLVLPVLIKDDNNKNNIFIINKFFLKWKVK